MRHRKLFLGSMLAFSTPQAVPAAPAFWDSSTIIDPDTQVPASDAGTGTITLNNLTVGRTHLTQVRVNGSRTTGSGRNLTVASSASTYLILNNTSAGAISGSFAGLPEGTLFNSSGYDWQITYLGGDGNDATVTLPKFALLAARSQGFP